MSGKWTQDERMQKAVDYLTAFDGGLESMCSVYDSKLSRKGFIVATIHPHDIPTRI